MQSTSSSGSTPRHGTSGRARLIELHLDVADRLAHRYSNRGEPPEDIVQVASLALVKAVDRFDPSTGSPFVSYAAPTIVGEIKRYFRDHARAVRVPRRMQELSQELNKTRDVLAEDLRRVPDLDEVAEALGVDRDEASWAAAAGRVYHLPSIDSLIEPDGDSDGETRLERTIGAEDPEFDRTDARMCVEELAGELSDREWEVLRMRYFDHKRQAAIAEELDMSQMQVSRLIAAVLGRLRRTGIVHAAS